MRKQLTPLQRLLEEFQADTGQILPLLDKKINAASRAAQRKADYDKKRYQENAEIRRKKREAARQRNLEHPEKKKEYDQKYGKKYGARNAKRCYYKKKKAA